MHCNLWKYNAAMIGCTNNDILTVLQHHPVRGSSFFASAFNYTISMSSKKKEVSGYESSVFKNSVYLEI